MQNLNNPRGQILTYEDYYANQAGNGISQHWFKGSPHQRGHGVGSFLGGLFRTALPLLKKGALTAGRELLNSGVNMLTDLDTGVSFKESAKKRLNESVNNLKRKATDEVYGFLNGKGYKNKKRRKTRQSKKKPRRRRTGNTSKQSGKGGKKKYRRKSKVTRHKKTKKRKYSRKNTRNKYELITSDIFS